MKKSLLTILPAMAARRWWPAIAVAALFVMLVLPVAPAHAQMTDNQIVEFVKRANDQGKGQSEIASELIQRGVSKEQLMRIRAEYLGGAGEGMGSSGTRVGGATDGRMLGGMAEQTSADRIRRMPGSRQQAGRDSDRGSDRGADGAGGRMAWGDDREVPRDGRGGRGTGRDGYGDGYGGPEGTQGGAFYGAEDYYEHDWSDPDGLPISEYDRQGRRMRTDPRSGNGAFRNSRRIGNEIFGHDVFNNKLLTFEPSLNIATPDNYTLGPGDEVIIDIWGDSEQTIRQKISPDGIIVINRIGPVTLNGLTVQEADAKLKKSFSRIYSSVGGANPATFVKLSLGQIRSIQVHVMGEVAYPGTYTVASLASLFHVLYNAGGVNAIGSMRDIGVSRGGRQIARADIYSYLLDGKTEVDIALKDGDVVMVPPYKNMVAVSGGVKRPMRYEMKDGETMATLLGFAGGFTGDSYKDAVTVVRRNGRLQQVHNIGSGEYEKFTLVDGDDVTVGEMTERFANRLEITGAVFRPGLYAISDSVSTVGQLIAQAQGFRGDAFTGRAILTREKPDYTLEAIPLDVGAIVSGAAADITLQTNDWLYVPSIFNMREAYFVTIHGAVRLPGDYGFADNLSIEDMIVKAGGLLESASTAKVDVYRRVKDPGTMLDNEVRAESFTFTIRDGLVVGDGNEFVLQPFDMVEVRDSPGYEVQKTVQVRGQVLFPGEYTLVEREERLSDLIARSGGALEKAYLKGASLERQMSRGEKTRVQTLMGLSKIDGRDSLSMADLNIADTYRVGIELDKALEKPGSDYDLILREGDVLRVPQHVGTVSISGAVLFPNSVAFREGMKVKDYIDQAGGYAHKAHRSSKIVVYMNGTVRRSSCCKHAKIAPGCEIVVPYKTLNPNRIRFAEILSLGLSATSTAAVIANLIGTLNK